MSELVLSGLSKTFPGGVKAVDRIDLTIASGELMVLVGPSGCGKTTLLRMIAGLEAVDEGSIRLDGRDITDLEARDRDIAMVFQNYALYPHMNVRENLSYGLRVRKTPKLELERRVDEVAELLGLQDLLDRVPAALSGGQRQRVAMGRAIARRPRVYLMDEPLSNLDAKLRVRVRADLARLHAQLGVTTVYVTHDQVEAMQLGQRAAVLRDGRVQQVARPQTLYRDSANLFVASFIGSPSMNLVRAELDGDAIRFAGYRVPLDRGRRPPQGSPGQVILGIRPEDFEDARFAPPGLPTVDVSIGMVEDLGPEALAFFTLDAERVESEAFGVASDNSDQEALMAGDRRALFSATLDAATAARAGETCRLTVNPARFHFFNTYNGASLLDSAAGAARLLEQALRDDEDRRDAPLARLPEARHSGALPARARDDEDLAWTRRRRYVPRVAQAAAKRP